MRIPSILRHGAFAVTLSGVATFGPTFALSNEPSQQESFLPRSVEQASDMATNFSGIPPMPQQQAQNPANPRVQMHFNLAQPSPYDRPDFVVPPYEIQP
jgi:hypothetical protein